MARALHDRCQHAELESLDANPRDDDRDGLVDEDGPDDLDGDGSITTMRKRDPFGQFRTDAEDARLMVRIKPGEQGEWTMLGAEGLDNDGDGRVNEDPEGYLDGNRNWGYNWAPPYVQTGSGEYRSRRSRRARSRPSSRRVPTSSRFTRFTTLVACTCAVEHEGAGTAQPAGRRVYDILGATPRRSSRLPLPRVVEGPLRDLRRLHRLHLQRDWPTASSANCSWLARRRTRGRPRPPPRRPRT